MAIDTALKRSSVLQLKLPFRMILPFPTGSISTQTRPAIVGAYAGTTYIPPTPTSGAIIKGLTMIEEGLTILSGLTTSLIKGLVKDELNLINR
jgi:hypothetical protein